LFLMTISYRLYFVGRRQKNRRRRNTPYETKRKREKGINKRSKYTLIN